MEILTEFDELQAALAKVNMNESVLPYVKGRLVVNESAYNKTQKILNCPEMISAHKYLYELDMDQLTDDDTEKIDKLYDLGVKRGFIIDDLTDWDAEDGDEEVEDDLTVDVEQPAVQRQPQNTLFKAKIPCWTVIYSATKDGDIKTGEAYSNAVSITAAKADVNAKLSQCGYDNITILAIENCMNASASQAPVDETPDAEEVVDIQTTEVSEADDEEKDSSGDDSSEDASDDTSDGAGDDDSSDDSSADEDANDNSGNEDDASDEEDSGDEDTSDADEESSNDDSSDEDTSSEDSGDEDTSDEEDTEEQSDEEDSEGDEESNEESGDEESDEETDELDANEKAELRDLYRKTFRNTLIKCKFDTSFNDLTLEQKVKFFTELAKAWKKDNEPQEFMTDKELEQLDNVVAYKDTDDSDDGSEEDEDGSSDDEEN